MNLIRFIFQNLLPTSCAFCDVLAHELCSSCQTQLKIIESPYCSRCGIPFSSGQSNRLCFRCEKKLPAYDCHQSLFLFESQVCDLVYQLKNNNRLIPRNFVQQRLRYLDLRYKQADLIVAVPLHHQSLMRRGFNQTHKFARVVSDAIKIPFDGKILEKITITEHQKELKRDERLKNLMGCFVVKSAATLKNKSIVLVDDVHTTGATLNAVAHCLKSAGAKHVFALSLAIVPLN